MRLNLALSEPKARLDAIGVEDRPLYKLKRKIPHPFTGEGLVSPPLSDEEMTEAELIWDTDYLNSVEDYKEKRISQLSEQQKEMGLGDEIKKISIRFKPIKARDMRQNPRKRPESIISRLSVSIPFSLFELPRPQR